MVYYWHKQQINAKGGTDMTAKDYRQAAWEKLSGKWGTAVIGYLIYGLIIGAAGATFIGGLILAGPMMFGLAAFFLWFARRQTPQIETLFSGFSYCFVNSMLAGILTTVFTFLWSLLFVVPGIIKMYGYSMTMYVLADHPEMNAMEAIAESQRIMQGNKWRLFCLDLSFIGWILLCGLTCGILTLWVAPYQQTARAEFYESIR